MTEPHYYRDTDDPGDYAARQTWINARSHEAKAEGCNVTRTEIEGNRLMFKGWRHPSAAPPTEGINTEFDDAWQAKDGRISSGVPTEPIRNIGYGYESVSEPMEPTAHLRFVYKDGRYVLQQLWQSSPDENEWRDVPTVDATQP